MRIIGIAIFGCLLGCAGCVTHSPLRVGPRDFGPDPVYTEIRARISEESRKVTGRKRWREYCSVQYQSSADLARSRAAADRARKRREAARRLLKGDGVTLEECLIFALEFNDRIQARREGMRAVGGDALIGQSRFLPSLTYSLTSESTHERGAHFWTHETESTFGFSQTLLEFGKHADDDISLRNSQRRSLFAFEETVRDVFSDVRTRFYTILLRQQQKSRRQELLAEFKRRYEVVRTLERSRRVLEVDVLTARLNVLNEEARINSLEQEILRQKIDLLRGAGLPVDMIQVNLRGRIEDFQMPLDRAIDLALRRSSAIASARAIVAEQYRKARQTLWEYFPQIDLEVGRQKDDMTGGFRVNGDDGKFALSTFGEKTTPSGPGVQKPDEERRYAELTMELPLFDGLERYGRYKREKANLAKTRHQLRDTIDQVEANVRKEYQTLLERKKELEILKETVQISKERLRVQERLKDLGRISDDALETFRNRFFSDQDRFFTQQISVVQAQERLRRAMRFFELLPADDKAEPLPEKRP